MLLAVDTSAGTEAAVVGERGDVRAEYRLDDRRHHAEAIGAAIAAVLRDAGITPAEVREVVVGMGPGPFTGLRVGVAAARVFAAARGIPLIPLGSHDAIAHAWRAEHPEADGELLVTTDARRHELACSRYPLGWVLPASGPVLLGKQDVDAGFTEVSHRIDATSVPAAHLALAWQARQRLALAPDVDRLVYLRAPDAVPAAAVKRVSR